MVRMQTVDKQLKAIGADFHLWGRAEKQELQQLLVESEVISHCLNGRYGGGLAMLCATDRRILLIDRKTSHLTVEDVRYDMVLEVDFSHRLLDATVTICTVNRTLIFTSFHNKELRELITFLQTQAMGIHQINVPVSYTHLTLPTNREV